MAIYVIFSSVVIFFLCVALAIAVQYNIKRSGRKAAEYSTVPLLDVLEDPRQIRSTLGTIDGTRTNLKIRLNDRGRPFTSSVLKVENDHLLIDALFPHEGNDLIQDTGFLNVEFVIKKQKHIPYQFTSRFIAKETYNDFPAIKIHLPGTIKRDQKRNFHRIEPSVSDPIYIRFTLENRTYEEKAANISGGGIGFYTNLSGDVLWPGRELHDATITLPKPLSVECLSVIHTIHNRDHPVLINNKTASYYCGAEFDRIDKQARDTIIKYVIEKEREELKRLNRTISG